MFAYGGTLMLRNASETNNPSADLKLAVGVFGKIQEKFASTGYAAQAGGEIGKCYFQLGAQDPGSLVLASNAFQQVIDSSHASVTARSQAQVGLAMTLEAQAQRLAGAEQSALLKLALKHYLDVFYLRDSEQPDLFWEKKAGLEAARVSEAMQEWTQAVNLYRSLGKLLLPLKESLERKIQKAQEHLPPEKN